MRVSVQLNSPVMGDSEAFARTARALLEGVAFANQEHIARHGAPLLYESGARYLREPAGVETFVDIPTVLAQGGGDCAHLAAYRVAELRAAGIPARFRLIWQRAQDGRRVFHVQVRTPKGVEDPSVLLGMPPIE